MTFDKLTARQRRCAELAARGIPNSEIAELMGVKLRTVKAHLARVFALLGIHDGHKRTKLAALLNEHDPAPPIPSLHIFVLSMMSAACPIELNSVHGGQHTINDFDERSHQKINQASAGGEKPP